jgi:hypothetical protein
VSDQPGLFAMLQRLYAAMVVDGVADLAAQFPKPGKTSAPMT